MRKLYITFSFPPYTILQVKRFLIIDYLRALAVILMIIFHLGYDLNYFQWVTIDFVKDQFWFIFPRVIVFLFLICVGLGQALEHQKGIRWPRARKRFLKLSAFALLISLITYFIFPRNWVFFGTLHCIALSSLMSLPFLHRPNLSLILGLGLILAKFTLPWDLFPLQAWLKIRSVDYIPLYPWFGVVLIGIWLKHRGFHQILTSPLPGHKLWHFFGKHSLEIYLIHQPILFGGLWLVHKLTAS